MANSGTYNRTKVHFAEGSAPSTPDATEVVIYAKSDGLMYSKDDAGTETLLSGGDATTHIADATDAHDASAISVADSGANFTGTNVETVLAELQDNIDGVSAASGISYFSRRLWAQDPANANATFNLNSASYVAVGTLQFYHDWDFFPATHFLITAYGFSSESGQTVTAQLAPGASPTNPVSFGGDDLAITFNGGAVLLFTSGWIAVSDAMAGITAMTVALKGSNASVDFTGRWIDIAMKIDS